MRSDNMLLLHGNNRYHAKEHEYQGTDIVAENTYRSEFGLKVYGKSTQNGVPSPENPIPINSIGDSGSVDVVVSDNNGNSQTLTINTPNGLCGIPVDTGGNYTDSTWQQWICDEVDFERGVYVQRIGRIASYNNEQLSTKYMSTTGKLTTGASVIYILVTPIETPLTAEELSAYKAIKSYPHYTHIKSAAELRVKLKEY